MFTKKKNNFSKIFLSGLLVAAVATGYALHDTGISKDDDAKTDKLLESEQKKYIKTNVIKRPDSNEKPVFKSRDNFIDTGDTIPFMGTTQI